MTTEEIKNSAKTLESQMSRLDYVKLCRAMEHIIESWDRTDEYIFNIYTKILEESGD